MLLLDSTGAVVARGGGKTLSPGEATLVDFTPPARERVQVRAVANLVSGDMSFLKASVEIIDSDTSRTSLFIRTDKPEF
jgi:hypothetical protein